MDNIAKFPLLEDFYTNEILPLYMLSEDNIIKQAHEKIANVLQKKQKDKEVDDGCIG